MSVLAEMQCAYFNYQHTAFSFFFKAAHNRCLTIMLFYFQFFQGEFIICLTIMLFSSMIQVQAVGACEMRKTLIGERVLTSVED